MESKGKLFFLFDNCFPKILSLIPQKNVIPPIQRKKNLKTKFHSAQPFIISGKINDFQRGLLLIFQENLHPCVANRPE